MDGSALARVRTFDAQPAALNAAAAAAAHGNVATVAPPRTSGALAAVLNILQDGEVVLLILKPSLWFIPMGALRFAAVVLILMIAAALLDQHLPGSNRAYQELGLFVLAGRATWAVLQWMGRWYVLTDHRIMRLGGVFTPNVFECPLRRVARTRILRSMRERLTRLGTIEVVPADESCPVAYWQMVARPHEVNDQIVAAINRAKQPGCW